MRALPSWFARMNKAQFTTFYTATYPRLWSYVYRLAGDADASSDIVQDSYIRFLRELPRERSEQAQRAYLFSIATNVTRDMWRRGKIHGQWIEQEAEPDATDNSLDYVTLRLDVTAALARLPLMQRSLLWLTYVEGYSHAEVAVMQQIQSASVKVLLVRARRRLAAICREMGIESGKQS